MRISLDPVPSATPRYPRTRYPATRQVSGSPTTRLAWFVLGSAV
jgi:hypothetical protein